MHADSTVRRRLVALAYLDEVGPLVTLQTLWCAEHGITVGQLSAVFVLWAFGGRVLEVHGGEGGGVASRS